MSASEKYNKEKRKSLKINFYNKDMKYIEDLKEVPGSSNVKRIIYLLNLFKEEQLSSSKKIQ